MTVWELIKPARRAMFTSATLTGLGAVFSILPYVALTEIAADLLEGASGSTLWRWAITGILGIALGSFLYSAGLGLTHVAEADLRYDLRRRLVTTLGRIPLGAVDQTSSGKIRKIVADDTGSIHTLVAHLAGDATTTLIAFLAGFGYLVWVDWRMSAILLAIWAIVLMLVMRLTFHGLDNLTEGFSEAQARLSAATVEMVEGIKEIKNFQGADAVHTRFSKARDHFSKLSYDWTAASGRGIAFIGSFFQPAVIFATVAPIAIWFVDAGWIDAAHTLPFFMVGLGMPAGLIQLIQLMEHLYEARQAATDTAAILSIPPMPEGGDITPDVDDDYSEDHSSVASDPEGAEPDADARPDTGHRERRGSKQLEPKAQEPDGPELGEARELDGPERKVRESDRSELGKVREPNGPERNTGASIELTDVVFGYDPETPIIRGVSFSAQPGSVTALVGPSGGGKTTLARLIARFYDVDAGSVAINGRDVRDASFEWLLSRVAIVLQDIALAHDTVANNIALGKPGATRAQIEDAARTAQIHERILRLPHGYETIIGEEGGFLSGGERQRLTIARTSIQDAPILILDEATAQSDPRSERDIHKALTKLSNGRTVIVIAHRLATITKADAVLVVADGKIAERGKHEELVSAGGIYANMWKHVAGATETTKNFDVDSEDN